MLFNDCRHLNEHLRNLEIDIINNSNISGEHVGRKGRPFECKGGREIGYEHNFLHTASLARHLKQVL